jgi:hypothetical protein
MQPQRVIDPGKQYKIFSSVKYLQEKEGYPAILSQDRCLGGNPCKDHMAASPVDFNNNMNKFKHVCSHLVESKIWTV